MNLLYHVIYVVESLNEIRKQTSFCECRNIDIIGYIFVEMGCDILMK